LFSFLLSFLALFLFTVLLCRHSEDYRRTIIKQRYQENFNNRIHALSNNSKIRRERRRRKKERRIRRRTTIVKGKWRKEI
jgi:hypothetical protein